MTMIPELAGQLTLDHCALWHWSKATCLGMPGISGGGDCGLWIGVWGVEVERENLTKSKQTENQSFTYPRPIATHFVAAFLLERILEFAAFCLSTMCNNIKERKTQPQLNRK